MLVMRGWDPEYVQWLWMSEPEDLFDARRKAARSELQPIELWDVGDQPEDIELIEVYTPHESSLF